MSSRFSFVYVVVIVSCKVIFLFAYFIFFVVLIKGFIVLIIGICTLEENIYSLKIHKPHIRRYLQSDRHRLHECK